MLLALRREMYEHFFTYLYLSRQYNLKFGITRM